MKQHNFSLFFAALLAWLPLTATAQPTPQSTFPDSVATLNTSEPLTTWGNLGGVTVDRLGFLYVANFRDAVWRIAPDGEAERLTNSLYGASGNAIDARGNLLQANFFANTISRISREGQVETLVDTGLNGPVGIAVGAADTLFVCNCSGNEIVRVSPDGRTVETLAAGPPFSCPNGITRVPDGTLYVVNFNTDEVIRLRPGDGTFDVLATLPAGGNAHLTYARGNLYVTKLTTNRVYRVTMDGEVSLVAGTGAVGFEDGPALKATLARPNGIAANVAGDVLYLNTLEGQWTGGKKGQLIVREVRLVSLSSVFRAALAEGGLEAARAAYRRYKEDPVRSEDNTLTEAVTLAYQLLSGGNPQAAIALFELNAASYPDQAAAHYNRGEGYRYTGQADKAIQAYERTLELNPDHANAVARLKLLRGE